MGTDGWRALSQDSDISRLWEALARPAPRPQHLGTDLGFLRFSGTRNFSVLSKTWLWRLDDSVSLSEARHDLHNDVMHRHSVWKTSSHINDFTYPMK